MEHLTSLVVSIYALGLIFLFCFSLIQLALAWNYGRYQIHKKVVAPEPEPLNWPFVTIQLPLYNEMFVVERLLAAITRLDYPDGKLEIQVLDDSSDETSALIQNFIQNNSSSANRLHHIRRPDRSGYKAGALQFGLETARGEFIGIFDADFLPDPDFLIKTIPAFKNPAIGVVQTRWGHLNEDYSFLTRLQAFGLNAHFTVEQVGRAAGGHFINFNGTAGIWRKSAILDAGGWEADTLTEDLDLSYRAQLKNWQILYREEVVTPAELPANMPAIKSQQFRWTKGAAETARKNLGRVWLSDKPWQTKIFATFHLLNSSVFVCLLLLSLLSVPMLYFRPDFGFWSVFFQYQVLFVLSLVSLVSFYWLTFRRTYTCTKNQLWAFLSRFFPFLSLMMGLSLHNALAVLEGFSGKKSPFIRTPKFNIRSDQDSWRKNKYFTPSRSVLPFLEAGLSLYFLGGLYLGISSGQYGLLPFHLMLTAGYAVVAFYSFRHGR